MRTPEATERPHGRGRVLFAHGGSSEHGSARSAFLADRLARLGVEGEVIHLLSRREADDPERRRDADLLSRRMREALEARRFAEPTGLVAGGRLAAAVVSTLVLSPDLVDAAALLTPRFGGPPEALPELRKPVMMIVGEWDAAGRAEAERACARLGDGACLRAAPLAGRYFEEAAALDTVACILSEWFSMRFADSSRARPRQA
jgi:hypothetical protein